MTPAPAIAAAVVFLIPFAVYRAEQGMQRKQAERKAAQKRLDEVLGGQQ